MKQGFPKGLVKKQVINIYDFLEACNSDTAPFGTHDSTNR